MNEYKIEYKNIVYSRRLNNSLSVETIVTKAACGLCAVPTSYL